MSSTVSGLPYKDSDDEGAAKILPKNCSLCGEQFSEPGNKIVSDASESASDLGVVCDACVTNLIEVSEITIAATSVQQPTLECDKCGATFQSNLALEFHCQLCQGSNSRLMNSFEDKPFICNSCGKGFASAPQLKQHFLIHTGEKPYKFSPSNQKFADSYTYQKHLGFHSREKQYVCPVGEKRFSGKKTMIAHQVVNIGERPFQCKLCPKNFKYKHALQIHYDRHNAAKNFVCNICEKWFRNKEALVRHGSVHTGVEPNSCQKCGNTFPRAGSLKCHTCELKQRNQSEQRVRIPYKFMPYSCGYCSKNFYYEATLAVHLASCKKQYLLKRYRCDMCDKTFDRKSNLELHYAIHSPKENYVCTVCNAVYFRKKSFEEHLKRHSRKYYCDTCDRSFATMSSFSNHNLAHSETRIEHSFFEKTFKSEKDREKHEKLCNKLEFVCELCSRVFIHERLLAEHKADHKKPVVYNCFFCSMKFNNNNELAIHYLSHSANHNSVEN